MSILINKDTKILVQGLTGKTGTFHTDDADLLANTLYATGLGGLQLARVGMLVKEAAPGMPVVATLSPAQVKEHLVASSLAIAVGVPG